MTERIAVVGAGYWSQFQFEGWRDAGAPVAAMCNRSPANAAPLAERFGVSDAAKERKVLAIGNVVDTQPQYPDTVIAAADKRLQGKRQHVRKARRSQP